MTGAKPPYVVPTMSEIAAMRPNGYQAVSLFAGGGGSSTGYRMAGFRVRFASEFVPAAAETYEANAAPGTVVDRRDIRDITGADILDAIGCDVGTLDVLDGSPPCAAFSTAGIRDAGWGKRKAYSSTEQVVDDLFYEYARILGDVQPRVFVAENVAGLVKGTAKGYFKLILDALRAKGYRVGARVLNASWLGVPQRRPRLIFVGVRDDLNLAPVHPAPLPYQYSVSEALPGVELQANSDGYLKYMRLRPATRPSGTLGTRLVMPNSAAPTAVVGTRPGAASAGVEWDNDGQPYCAETGYHLAWPKRDDYPPGMVLRYMSIREARLVSGFPPDFALGGSYAQRWERIGRAVPPVMMRAVAAAAESILNTASRG